MGTSSSPSSPSKYFTKWIEARVVSTVTSKTAQKFF
jgi:transposase InsO family protein